MYNKKLTLFFIVFLSTANITCNKETCDVVDFLADLVIDTFTVVVGGEGPIVNVATGTAITIKNLLYAKACEDDNTFQREAGVSYAEYDVFYREDANDDWQAVETSDQILVQSLAAGAAQTIGDSVTFALVGEYRLRAKADVGNDVEERLDENEREIDNNERELDNGILDARYSNVKFIRVKADENTDFELMKKRKEQGIYVIFK